MDHINIYSQSGYLLVGDPCYFSDAIRILYQVKPSDEEAPHTLNPHSIEVGGCVLLKVGEEGLAFGCSGTDPAKMVVSQDLLAEIPPVQEVNVPEKWTQHLRCPFRTYVGMDYELPVDSGTMAVIDPFVVPVPPQLADWSEAANEIIENDHTTEHGESWLVMDGRILVSWTSYGDGCYPGEVQYENGKLVGFVVHFEDKEPTDDEREEEYNPFEEEEDEYEFQY